jgi:hypothetical protein
VVIGGRRPVREQTRFYFITHLKSVKIYRSHLPFRLN